MQLTRGRGLAAMAAAGSSPVAVVNESAARRFWPDADPIGRQFTFDIGPDRRVAFTVIGIAADTRSSGINTRSFATAFVSFWQLPWPAFEIVVHQSRAGMLTAEDVRRVVASIDAGVPVGSVRMMEQLTARAVAEPRYHMILMMVFGGLAVVLAMVGCYGVLSYSVAQRTREIGVRVALGATRGVIVRSVVMRGAMLVLLGLMIGTALAFALTRVLESSLYEVTPTDPAAFALAAAGLAAVSLIATYLPARRAAAVQPAEALRAE
jgi:putative ABC transport system permease protein